MLSGPVYVFTSTGIVSLLFQKDRPASNMESRHLKHKAEELETHHSY